MRTPVTMSLRARLVLSHLSVALVAVVVGALASPMAAAITAVASAMFLGLGMERPLNRPMQALLGATRRMAGAAPTPRFGTDETDCLLDAVNAATQELESTVGALSEAAATAVGACEGVHRLARGQDEAALELCTTSARVAAATHSARAGAEELCRSTERLARWSGELALATTEGHASISSLTATMGHVREGIESLSQRLTDLSAQAMPIDAVVATISTIANRTNILAVNASIEAGSADRTGSGFHVVAAEIDRLARQTASSAREIESMIASLQRSMGEGMRELSHYALVVERGCDASASATGHVDRVLGQVERFQASVDEVIRLIRAQASSVIAVDAEMEGLADRARRANAHAVAATQASEALDEARRRLDAAAARVRPSTARATAVHSDA